MTKDQNKTPFVMVPVEATREMHIAGHDAQCIAEAEYPEHGTVISCIWEAMIASRPAAPIKRCERCDWPLADKVADGCVEGNCSMRPLPPLRPAAPVTDVEIDMPRKAAFLKNCEEGIAPHAVFLNRTLAISRSWTNYTHKTGQYFPAFWDENAGGFAFVTTKEQAEEFRAALQPHKEQK